MYQLLLPAVIIIGAGAPATVLAEDHKIDPATAPILKQEKDKQAGGTRASNRPPGTSAAETAGARIPDAENGSTRGTGRPQPTVTR